MSVVTSVLGMTPLAMGTGAGTELYRSLGAVLIGGLLVLMVDAFVKTKYGSGLYDRGSRRRSGVDIRLED